MSSQICQNISKSIVSTKNLPTIIVKGEKPSGNIFKAKIPTNTTSFATFDNKVMLGIKSFIKIGTGSEVLIPEGYLLRVKLVDCLVNKGVMITSSDIGRKGGELVVGIVNFGYEILEIKDGDPLIELMIEEEVRYNWGD